MGGAYVVRFVAERQLNRVLARAGGDALRAAAAVAAEQRGAIAGAQLQALGVTRHTVAGLRRRGLLQPLFPRVFVWGAIPAPGTREAAAILVCRHRGLIAHEAAAALWAFGPEPTTISVLLRSGRTRSAPGLIVRRSDTLRREDLRRRWGLPVTAPERVLLDLAADGHRDLERFVSNAHAQGLVTPRGLERYLGARPGMKGVGTLRPLVGLERRGFTRSQNERRMRALCRQAGLPQPQANTRLLGWAVDFLWPAERVVVEVDALNTHGHATQFERDRRKQRALVAAGHPVLRITDRMLHDEPLPVAVDLAQTLARAERPA